MLLKSILTNNLDDIPDAFKIYNFDLSKDKAKNINKNIKVQDKKKELTNKISSSVDFDINLNSKTNNKLDIDFLNHDQGFNSNKIIFLLVLFLLNSCE